MARTRPSDPSYHLLLDDYTSTPVVYRSWCYICNDPEFAQMGLPLCRKCPKCKDGHIQADDSVCDLCGYDDTDDGPSLNFYLEAHGECNRANIEEYHWRSSRDMLNRFEPVLLPGDIVDHSVHKQS